jgi:hypothetical protein
MNTTENNQLIASFLGQTSTNKLIADFMDFVESPETNKYWTNKSSEGFGIGELVDLQFDTDWNWLMQVVEKIFKDFYNLNPCPIGLKMKIEGHIVKANKYEVYNACVEFIKWYNQQNQ